jgi:ribosomal protein S18 acetylase RimI-like enzyme
VFARALGGTALSRRTAFISRDHSAVALWLAPDAEPDEQALAELIEDGIASEKQATIAAVIERMVRCHPQEPHWYLPFIGVEPIHQGRGLGAALLQAQLSRCDAAQLPAYLESTNPMNQRLYERHGFRPIAEIKVADCPPIVPMLRQPNR